VFILALATGCIHVRATTAPDANLAQYRTFAFSSETNQARDRAAEAHRAIEQRRTKGSTVVTTRSGTGT